MIHPSKSMDITTMVITKISLALTICLPENQPKYHVLYISTVPFVAVINSKTFSNSIYLCIFTIQNKIEVACRPKAYGVPWPSGQAHWIQVSDLQIVGLCPGLTSVFSI